jgi:hypothetical protein
LGERKTGMLKFDGEKTTTKRDSIMINKIDFAAKNLTLNTGLFLLFKNTKANGIFELIDPNLIFDNESTNKIKMNHIKAMLYLRKFRQNSHPVWVKMMAILFRRGISVYITYNAQV